MPLAPPTPSSGPIRYSSAGEQPLLLPLPRRVLRAKPVATPPLAMQRVRASLVAAVRMKRLSLIGRQRAGLADVSRPP